MKFPTLPAIAMRFDQRELRQMIAAGQNNFKFKISRRILKSQLNAVVCLEKFGFHKVANVKEVGPGIWVSFYQSDNSFSGG